MRSAVRARSGLLSAMGLAAAISIALSACTGAAPASPAMSAPASPTIAPGKSATPTAKASATASNAAASHVPMGTPVGTTQTAWGRILDVVPAEFPVFPGATRADPPPSGPVSGAWVAKAPVDEVATWYHDAVLAAHFAKAELGSPLENGSRVLDAQGDAAACRAQVAVAPAGSLTMITVLLGAGCAGSGG